MGSKLRSKLWRPEYQDSVASMVHPFAHIFPDMSTISADSLAQYMDYQTYLPFDILTKVDVASMIHGLEVRTPLVDVKVAEFAATIPADVTFGLDQNGQWHSKRLLRQILSKYFPFTFIDRPKMGFSVPIKKWFAPGGALRHDLEDLILRSGAKIHEYFNPAVIEKLVHEHGDKKNMAKSLWQLLFLEYWLKNYERDSE
jgi:asparagine synthase (glutamine-hydrolysing)